MFGLTTDQVIHDDSRLSQEVTVENKPDLEQLKLINQLDKDERQTVFKIIDTLLTKKKFKDFFQKNIVAL